MIAKILLLFSTELTITSWPVDERQVQEAQVITIRDFPLESETDKQEKLECLFSHFGSTLRELKIICTIKESGAQILARYLPQMTQLRSLDLYGSQIENGGLIAIAPFLNRSLVRLNLGRNCLSLEGIVHLVGYLWQTASLRELDLSTNLIGDVGMLVLAPSLPSCIEILTLENIDLSDDGLCSLSICFSRMEKLRVLNLKRNRIARVQALIQNPLPKSIRSLLLNSQIPGISYDFIKELKRALLREKPGLEID